MRISLVSQRTRPLSSWRHQLKFVTQAAATASVVEWGFWLGGGVFRILISAGFMAGDDVIRQDRRSHTGEHLNGLNLIYYRVRTIFSDSLPHSKQITATFTATF